ncbi:lysine--tRNA ligase-like [Artemia franciscana]|uniref:Lysine--tRNA ligase n=1 Tax=Artemia franciscana TaxID=6661 RepID=A0AA88HB48_ARTSF|nr:hypothetical protein QYM36_015949 [Artemia franciscana]
MLIPASCAGFAVWFGAKTIKQYFCRTKGRATERNCKEEPPKEIKEKSKIDDESPSEYFRKRSAAILAAQSAGYQPYPHKFSVTIAIDDFVHKYNQLDVGQFSEEKVSVAGRIHAVRESSSKLIFYDLHGDFTKIQVMVDARIYQSMYRKDVERIKRGDIIECVGYACKTKKGELSIRPEKMEILSPCLQMLPHHCGLKNKETRYRQRDLDLVVNNEVMKKFYLRSQITFYIREFLSKKKFIEVETPTMTAIAGGATAKPFVTHYNEYNSKMFMRISPELYLKRLVVGGINRVYELGKVYRNESSDSTHSPEFTICEFYKAYADYEDMMTITEDMLSGMVKSIYGTYRINYGLKGPDGPNEVIDFKPPFIRIRMFPELEKRLKVKLPHPSTLDTPEAVAVLDRISTKHGVNCPPPRTAARLLDKLVDHFLVGEITSPTFITDYPLVMSPLAKCHRTLEGLTERFELFVCKKEICNGYTELNDPFEQRKRFDQQAKDRAAGDDEAMIADENFLTALEYGLPPTGGCGMGIDRIAMFLTNSNNIKDVLFFPTMRPKDKPKNYAQENG